MQASTSREAVVLLDELTEVQRELGKLKGKLKQQHRERLRGSVVEDDVEAVTRALDHLAGAIERLSQRREIFISETEGHKASEAAGET
jgi:phosphopantothenate synthetase